MRPQRLKINMNVVYAESSYYNLDLVDSLVKHCLQVNHTGSQYVFVLLQ